MSRLIRLMLFLFGLSFAASAQQPNPQPNAEQQEIAKRGELVSTRIDLNVQILSGLREYKQLEADRALMQQLQQEYMAAGMPKPPAPKPDAKDAKPEPAKPLDPPGAAKPAAPAPPAAKK